MLRPFESLSCPLSVCEGSLWLPVYWRPVQGVSVTRGVDSSIPRDDEERMDAATFSWRERG